MIRRTKATGRRGEWFATLADDGERLPCVHRHWLRGADYDDPHAAPDLAPWPGFIAAIRDGRRVILTEDRVIPPARRGDPPGFERLGCIAVFEVGEVRVEPRAGTRHRLRFRLIRRVADLA